jgi:hypothetical protein
MGALAGLPIFILVIVSPLLFMSGLVEIFKSCIWTQAYRDLKAMHRPVQADALQAQIAPAGRTLDEKSRASSPATGPSGNGRIQPQARTKGMRMDSIQT